jgi:hypothetical protein
MNECFWNGCETGIFLNDETDTLYRKCFRCGSRSYYFDPCDPVAGMGRMRHPGLKHYLLFGFCFGILLCLTVLAMWGLWILAEKIQP